MISGDRAWNEGVVRPRGPVIARDGRPFAATPGARAVTLPWPLPGTVAGMLRTSIGTALGFDWRGDGPKRARAIAVQGPLMLAQRKAAGPWEVYLPAPRDALTLTPQEGDQPRRYALRPYPDDELPSDAGCDLPDGLRPLWVREAGKAIGTELYWSMKAYRDWLTKDEAKSDPVATAETLAEPPRETRVHVAIDPATGMGREGALFSTEGLAFADQSKQWHEPARHDEPARALLCRVATSEDWAPDDPCFALLGGERRLVELHKNGLAPWPACSDELRQALTGASHLRLALATPAIFDGGWRPRWIDKHTLEGAPPGLDDIRLRLVSAAVGRRTAVSGWNMQRERDADGRWKEKGPKAVRYMAPAGSVYFFELLSGPLQERQIDKLWMAALSDDAQDSLDGYGLALPGLWQSAGRQ